ncbi:ATP12 family chaperone protein [Amaricoccus solimangrovi]|uniref:ATPase n=1 Tax=Amaricoccus solimangrovi TaxID=2589815 RepID=A0A501WT07_9RHOB|nr:ATP12 family protein [Amaricoccus solimangrovi]TPE50417.1 ATPase [Amaricoccus solimangrovi]
MSWKPRRKFWDEVSVAPAEAGHTVRLDARELRTPGQAPLVVPTAALAEAIAGEWRAITGEIDPEILHYTKAANTAIDRVSREREAVIDAIAAYGDSDLLCYRAEEPEGLAARQKAAWQPWLDWAEAAFGAALVPVRGVMHRAQDAASLAALRREVARFDALGLTALYDLVTLSGSLVLGLAVARGALAGAEAWEISRLDEIWQAEQWGVDLEAEQAAEVRRVAFLRAETLLGLLGTDEISS